MKHLALPYLEGVKCFIFNTTTMAIIVTYKPTRRLSMRIVKNGDVHVTVPIWIRKSKVEQFIEEHRDWIVRAQASTSERMKRRTEFYAQLPLQTKAQAEEARQRLMTLVGPMVEHHAALMGVQPRAITYKPMTSRWGVCHIKENTICFSLYLLLLPDWCIEHVVVHELCHLLEPSHNARFHSLMDHYFPRWKEARKLMRQISK